MQVVLEELDAVKMWQHLLRFGHHGIGVRQSCHEQLTRVFRHMHLARVARNVSQWTRAVARGSRHAVDLIT